MPDSIPPNLRGVYRTILEMLWGMEWVSSKDILGKTGQAEYARRIRELRGEFGYPIAQRTVGGEHHYRLEGRTPAFSTRRRKYFSDKDKREIVARDGFRCNICRQEGDGVQLMWDHRIPFDCGGETDSLNGQILCVTCNNIKRRACGSCAKETCEGCLFAYPEKGMHLIVIDLGSGLHERLSALSIGTGATEGECAKDLIDKGLRALDR